jgi:hypothetical protein
MKIVSRFNEQFNIPLPPLPRYKRCACGNCKECVDNEKWDRIFAKFEVAEQDNWDTKGLYGSTLRGW